MILRQKATESFARLVRIFRGYGGKAVPPELEEQALVASLARDPRRADLAVTLARLLRKQKRPLDSVAGLEDWCLTTDSHTRALEPFVFMHIPKTAGSVMRLIILSLFDQSRVFPGWNYPDYNPEKGDLISRLDPERHGVFVGHMRWNAISCIEEILQYKTTVFTVLREPVDHYRSQMSFIDRLAEQGTTRTIMDGENIDFVDFWDDEARAKFGIIVLETQVASILATEHPYFRNMLRPDAFKYLVRPDDEQIQKARTVLAERLEGIHIAFFEDLRRSIDLCCKKLELPYQIIPGLRLNSSLADHSKGLSAEQIAQVEERRSLSFEFDAIARQRFETEYQAAFAGVYDVPAHLNNAYRMALLAKLEPHWCIHLNAGCAWPGYGWGFRENNQHGQVWRQLGPDGRATIIARLHGGCNFFVSLTVHSCDSEEALARVMVSANGFPLPAEGRGFIDGYYVLNWLMPSSCLAKTDGSVELVFDLPIDDGEKRPFFAVAMVQVYPAMTAKRPTI